MPRGDNDVDWTRGRIDAEGVKTAVDDGTQIAIVEVIRSDNVHADFLELVGRVRNLHPINAATVVEPANVIVETEDGRPLVARVVAADAFEKP